MKNKAINDHYIPYTIQFESATDTVDTHNKSIIMHSLLSILGIGSGWTIGGGWRIIGGGGSTITGSGASTTGSGCMIIGGGGSTITGC